MTSDVQPVESEAREHRQRLLLLLALCAGVVLRLYFVLTTIGTSDVVYKTVWARLALEHGVGAAYAHSPFLNEPPLAVWGSMHLLRAAAALRVEFADLYRLLQVASDVGSALLLWTLRPAADRARFAALLLLLSPAAVFLSGFHCNVDPLMVFLTLLACALAMRGRHSAAALALAVATGVKIVPLLIVPLFCVHARQRWKSFAATYVLVVAAIFVPCVVTGGPSVLRNVFLYRGVGNWWGISSFAVFASSHLSASLAAGLLALYRRITVVIVIAAVTLVATRLVRSSSHALPGAIGAAFCAMIVLGSGFGVQYLAWPLAFLPFTIGRRASVALHALIGGFLFLVYSDWAGGWPWRFANSDAAGATTSTHVYLGWLVWCALLATFVRWLARDEQEASIAAD